MICWAREAITCGIRMYLENTRAVFAHGSGPQPAERVGIPTGVASFPGEMVALPREWVERNVNLKHFTQMKQGGHFAALEEPELYAKDVQDFIHAWRK